MTAMPDTAALDLDEPVPYTLTFKALDFLDLTTHPVTLFGVIGDSCDGWACGRFGPVPDDGQCRNCRDDG